MLTPTRRLLASSIVLALVATLGLVLAPSASAATKTFVSMIPPKYASSTSAVTFTGLVWPAVGQTVKVQRKDGSTWRTVDTAKVSRSSGKFSIAYKVKAGKKSFRLLVAKSSKSTAVTKKWSTFTADGKKYKSYIAKARKYIKAYCPKTPILVNTPLVDSYTVGMATEDYVTTWSSGSSRITYTWKHQIHLEPGMNNAELRHVALHECAHIVQYRRLVKGPQARTKLERTTAKVFKARAGEGGNGNERQADCMAIAITHKKQYGGYTQYCGGKRAASAKALWKAYGKKYQAPVYTFTRSS